MNAGNPYRPPAAPLTTRGVSQRPESGLASRGARLSAAMVDGLIWMAALLPIAVGTVLSGDPLMRTITYGLLGIGFALALIIGSANLIWVQSCGQTVGKRSQRIRVVRADGSPASLARIFFLRNFLPGLIGSLPILGVLFFFVDHLYIFGEQRRCVHDLMADTLVVPVLTCDR